MVISLVGIWSFFSGHLVILFGHFLVGIWYVVISFVGIWYVVISLVGIWYVVISLVGIWSFFRGLY